jgi:hypothetical protein
VFEPIDQSLCAVSRHTSVDLTEARNARQLKSGESTCQFLARWYDEP